MPRSIYQIRFILQQPSPIWKDFAIDNVKIHCNTTPLKDVRSKCFLLQELTVCIFIINQSIIKKKSYN